MSRNVRRSLIIGTGVAGLALAAASLALAQDAKDRKPATPPGQEKPAAGQEASLPPGWSQEEMQACIVAGTPGKMHEQLARSVGTWAGKTQMWMGPLASEPVQGQCSQTITSIMDGRYIKCEVTGELPGMGLFNGFGLTGYDNVSQKFVGSWIDNHSTGIMQGVGELSKDGKSIAWNFTTHCPLTKKPIVVRQIESYPDEKTQILEMFTTDPKSQKEYKCMRIEFTRKAP